MTCGSLFVLFSFLVSFQVQLEELCREVKAEMTLIPMFLEVRPWEPAPGEPEEQKIELVVRHH